MKVLVNAYKVEGKTNESLDAIGAAMQAWRGADRDMSRVAGLPRANRMVSRWFRGGFARFRAGFALISRGFAPVSRMISRGFALVSRGFARFRAGFANGFAVVSRGFARFREVSHT